MVLGVALPGAFSWISPGVEAMFAFMTFQNAMATTSRELLGVVRRPVPLLSALGILLVAMPLVAFALGNLLFPGNRDIVVGMVLECCV